MGNSKHLHDRQGETTHFTHTHLWMAANWALNRASKGAEVPLDAGLLALIAGALAVEAYLNYLGPKVCESWGRSEDRLPPKDKLKHICNALGFSIDSTQPDYEAFIRLFDVRNQLAHGRPETVRATWQAADSPSGKDPRLEATWMIHARPDKAYQLIWLVHDLLVEIGSFAGEDFEAFSVLTVGEARPMPHEPTA